MRPQASTCLLLLVAALTTPSSGRGAAVGPRGGRTPSESGAGTDLSDREPTADRPLGKTGPASSRRPGVKGSQVSGASRGEAWQVGTSEPPMEMKPLLDIDELLAYERRKGSKKTIPRPPSSTSGTTGAPDPVTAHVQHSTPQLAEMVESILHESTVQGPPTTLRPRQPPRVDLASQKPPLTTTGNTTNVEELLPELEEVLKNDVLQHKPTEPQPPHTEQIPLPQTPKVPDTEQDLKHILPTLKEEISSIFKKNETKVLTKTSPPKLPPVHPTMTHIRRPSLSDTDEGLKKVLPTLEDTISSIFKNSEAKIPVKTGRPVHPSVTDVRQPSLSDTEDDLKHILPTLEVALGNIFENSESKELNTTSQPALPPVHPTVTDIRRPSLSDADEDLKHILPTLEEALDSIFKNSESKVLNTTSQPALPLVHPTVTDIRRPSLSDADEDLKHILPTLEESLDSIFENSESKVLNTTSQPAVPPVLPTVTDIRRPSPSDADEDLKHILPTLEEALDSIFENSESKVLNTTSQPALPPVHLTDIRRPSSSDADEDLKHILPTLEESLGSIFENSEAKVLNTTSQPALPPVHPTVTDIRRPSPSDADEDLKHILPTLEEALDSIFENSESKVLNTTSQPALPPVHPTVTNIRRPSLSDADEDLKHILPTLEEALGSIFENSEAKVLTTTSRPALPPVHPTGTDIRQPSLSDAEEDLKHILPTLEEALGSIFENSEAKVLNTTSRPALPPVHPTVTDIRRPSLSDAEDLKHILPTLEEALGSIFENSEAKVLTTTSQPALPTVHPTMMAGSREQLAAVLPQLQEAIRSVLDEALLEQEAAAQKHSTPASAWQPSLQTTKDYGFDKFLPDLERVFGDILHNGESDHNATIHTTTVATSTVKTPIHPVITPTEKKLSLQTNVISSHSVPLFRALKSALHDVFSNQEVEANKAVKY